MEQTAARIIEKRIMRPYVKVTYPQVIGLKDRIIQTKINEIIRGTVYRMINDQLPQAGEMKEISGGFRININRDSIFSAVFEHYSYVQGAANGLTIVKSVTMDIRDGKLYNLEDIFKPASGYVARINELISEQITQRDIPLTTRFKTVTSRQDYYLTGNDLVIYFQLYEYTPYAYGIPEFHIPFINLSDIINENGPAARLNKE